MLSIFVWLLNQTPPDRKEILCDVHLKSDIASPVDMGHMFFLFFKSASSSRVLFMEQQGKCPNNCL